MSDLDLFGDPTDDMLRTADISPDELYRYTLNRVWGDHRKVLPWIMLNPSTADHQDDDPTIRRCIGFARRLGFGGITVVNLYAYRATDPRDMLAFVAPVGPKNDIVLERVLWEAWFRDLPVIAAWGANAQPERVARLLRMRHADTLHALGVTKDGAPKHPLARGVHRIPDGAAPVRWAR